MKKELAGVIAAALWLMVSNSTAATRHYQYDDNGSIVRGAVEIDENTGDIVDGTGLFYEYNDANRLVRVRVGSNTGPILEEYTYDYQGQRFKKVSALFKCEDGSGCESERYDFQGNRSAIEKDLSKTTYYIGKHYEEKASSAERVDNDSFVPADTSKTNHYFAHGQRVAKRAQRATIEFVDDGNGQPVDAPVTSDNKYYFLNNHLGSTDIVLGENAETIAKLKYYPFGEIRQPSEESYSYTGKEKDFATNQYYYEARYYDAGIRQFMQADTIVPKLYDPQSLNRYAYVRNNPIANIDPNGHWAVKAITLGYSITTDFLVTPAANLIQPLVDNITGVTELEAQVAELQSMDVAANPTSVASKADAISAKANSLSNGLGRTAAGVSLVKGAADGIMAIASGDLLAATESGVRVGVSAGQLMGGVDLNVDQSIEGLLAANQMDRVGEVYKSGKIGHDFYNVFSGKSEFFSDPNISTKEAIGLFVEVQDSMYNLGKGVWGMANELHD